VANAGSFAAGGRLWETDPDLWWRDVEVNLRGPALALHAVLPSMLSGERPGRRAGQRDGSRPHRRRLGVLHLEGGCAAAGGHRRRRAAGTGVVVLAVSPGMVPTDMTRAFPEGFLELRPELRDPPPQAWREAAPSPRLLLRIAAAS
jgi:NAD(P)-dependent dehydrogenase (short-subunit alcohol dehydrogenase family)